MFDWEELLVVAEDLLQRAPETKVEEAYYRSCINRAYYAAHKTACGALEANGFACPIDAPHGAVIRELRAHRDKTIKKIGFRLDSLRYHRVDADYYQGKGFDSAKAHSALNEAKNICISSRAI